MKKVLFSVCVFIHVIHADISNCPANVPRSSHVSTYGNSCLQIVPSSFKWTSARKYCQNRGGDLVTITSAAKQSFIMLQLSKNTRQKTWIGATDRVVEGKWLWVTGDVVNGHYGNWKQGQGPTKHGFLFSAATFEDCALLDYYDGGRWNDYLCDSIFYRYQFICEYAQITTTTLPPTTERTRTKTTTTKSTITTTHKPTTSSYIATTITTHKPTTSSYITTTTRHKPTTSSYITTTTTHKPTTSSYITTTTRHKPTTSSYITTTTTHKPTTSSSITTTTTHKPTTSSSFILTTIKRKPTVLSYKTTTARKQTTTAFTSTKITTHKMTTATETTRKSTASSPTKTTTTKKPTSSRQTTHIPGRISTGDSFSSSGTILIGNKSKQHGHNNGSKGLKGYVIGILVAGVVLIGVASVVVYFIVKRRKSMSRLGHSIENPLYVDEHSKPTFINTKNSDA